MDSLWPENMSNDRKTAAIDGLNRGRESTNQLQILLTKKQPLMQNDLVNAEDLVVEILTSFTNTISLFNSGESDEVSQFPADSLPRLNVRKSEDSGESSKCSTMKDRRGRYKRRKNSHSWTRVTSTPFDDGHAWRKYGQKAIQFCKHPKSYFRCTHKPDQGCKATKQVQKTEDDPPMYTTTYTEQHTCQNSHFLRPPQIIFDSTTPPLDDHQQAADSPFTLTFGSNNSPPQTLPENNSTNNDFMFSSFDHSIKQESIPHHEQQLHSSSDYLLGSPDIMTPYDSSGHMTVMSSTTLGSSDNYGGDVISEMRSLDMGNFMVGSVFEDVQFDLM